MTILKLRDYPNMFCNIGFNYQEMENIIKDYHLNFDRYKNERVEKGCRLPIFVYSFYDYIVRCQEIPTQMQFALYYLENNKDSLGCLCFDDNENRGLAARLNRAYPSLIRDLHFALMLKHRLPNLYVAYNCKLDVECGIDIAIYVKDQNKAYAINLYTDTCRAKEFRGLKANRHVTYDNINYIDVKVDLSKRVVGKIKVYTDLEVNHIKRAIGV